MTVSDVRGLNGQVLGVQRPRLVSVPAAAFVVAHGGAGQEAVDLAAVAGLVLDPWQRYVLEESLRERPGGKWACRDVCLICSRQNGKGSILEARELAGLYLLGEMELIHTAHQFKTSADHFKRIRGLIENTPDLARELKPRGIRESHGEESITLRTGARLRFVARSVNGSGRGFTKVDMLAIDEAYQAGSAALSSLLPTQLTSRNAQTWYTSSVVDRGPDTDALRRLRDRGRDGTSKQLGYFEFSAAPGSDPDDPVARAQANPGLGIRFPHEDLQSFRENMSDEDFSAEFMSIWPDLGGNSLIPLALWNSRRDVNAAPGDPVVFGLDCAPNLGSAAITACGPGRDRFPVLEVVEHQRGAGWTIPWLRERTERYETLTLGIDPSGPVSALLPELVKLPINLVQFDARQASQSCTSFVSTVADGRLWHRDDKRLTDAVQNAAQRPVGDSWRWSRKNSRIDICPLVAATNALWLHTSTVDVAESFW